MSETNPTSNAGRPREASLDISSAELQQLSLSITKLVTEYFSTVSDLRVFPETSGGKTIEALGASLPVDGAPLDQLLADCETIIHNSRHNGHPRFFGYVASPANAPAAFADLLASTLNSNVTSWRSGPAATEIERTVINWLATLIGYATNELPAHGLLTSGGSMANLTALLIAHRAKSAEASTTGLWNTSPMTVYASDQIHMSIPKAADILGIGRGQVRLIPTDDQFRINVPLLRQKLAEDLNQGLKPFCVVASAGTVNTGAVDPLAEMAEIAKEFKLWFHIDGAYGALAALDPTKRDLFAGLAAADSISLDPHKWLYVPIDSGCLLFRDAERAHAAFSFDGADYIKVHEQNSDEAFAFWNYGPELSRRFRALKIWLTLRYYGTQRITRTISEDMTMAAYLAERINAAPDFELLAAPVLSICCFRYLPETLRAAASANAVDRELDELNTNIMNALQRGGRAYLSSATIAGKFALRVCITNFRTSRKDIDETLEVIRETAKNSSESYARELSVALELARAAGAAILSFYDGPLDIEQKFGADDREPVTQADKVANELIVSRLQREFPDDGILAEESVDTARRLGKSRVWMIDPLDGTTGFIEGNGDFAVQIGLAENGRSVLGVVYQPLTGVLYRAVSGAGCWIERPNFAPVQARVSAHQDIQTMRLAASRSHRSPRMDKVVRAFGFQEEVLRGSVGIKVGLIVEQQCDIYIHLSPRTKQWDTCAPQIILHEAGGTLTDLFGQPLHYNVADVQNRNGVVASNGVAHQTIIESLQPLLEEFGRRAAG